MNRKPIIPKQTRLLHGGDYNPEQWPRAVWDEDMRLMDLAHVNVATVGVFSWVTLEPQEGQFNFGWLDEIMDKLAKTGRLAVLATPSAAQPAWLSKKYPEVLRTDADGHQRKHGNRVNFCWSSPVYREKSRAMAQRLAERYKDHPALAVWHVSNEYGGECHCSLCQEAFRRWLRAKFNNDLDALNAAYWTAFWSHTYQDWSEIEIPGPPYGETAINGLTIDWRRFVSDHIIDCYLNESEPLRQISPNIPITTNMMGTYPAIDYWKMAKHVDFVSWDSYPRFIDHPMQAENWVGVAFTHDLYRSLKQKPFLLIESTPSSSNWYPVMMLKRPGQHKLEGMQAVAHGSEGVMYFQWRKSRGSQEQFHGAVVAHDGRSDTRVFREVAEVGQALEGLGDVLGAGSSPQVAVVYDWENAWAIDAVVAVRIKGKNYLHTVVEHYRPFWEAGVPTDVIDSDQDFSRYRLIVAPMLYILKPGVAERIAKFVEKGGVFVGTYWSGIADENGLCFEGGFPGPLKDVLGIWIEDTDGLYDDQRVVIKACDGNALGLSGSFEARQYCDMVHAETADVLAVYGSEFYARNPALTRNSYGEGEAYFVASRNDAAFTSQFLKLLMRRMEIQPVLDAVLPEGVTVQCRSSETTDFLFVLNVTESSQTVIFSDAGSLSALDGDIVSDTLVLEPHGVRVLTRPRMGVSAVVHAQASE